MEYFWQSVESSLHSMEVSLHSMEALPHSMEASLHSMETSPPLMETSPHSMEIRSSDGNFRPTPRKRQKTGVNAQKQRFRPVWPSGQPNRWQGEAARPATATGAIPPSTGRCNQKTHRQKRGRSPRPLLFAGGATAGRAALKNQIDAAAESPNTVCCRHEREPNSHRLSRPKRASLCQY